MERRSNDLLLRAVLVGLFGVVGTSRVVAEEPAQNADRSDIEVVVTASRGLEQNKLEIPQSVFTLSQSELQKTGAGDLDDALRDYPNIGMAPSEGNSNYWQEGFSIRGLGSQRVLTLTDGIRQSGQGIGYGGGNLNLYDTLSIERIEVLKGPGSVLYGTDAFGGVINVITRSPKKREECGANGGLSFNYDGSSDMKRTGAYIDVGDENVGAVFGGSFLESGEPNLPDDNDPQGGSFRQSSFWGKVDFHINESTTLRLLGDYVQNRDVLILEDSMVLPVATFPPPGSMIPVSAPLYFRFPEYARSMVGAELTFQEPMESWTMAKTGVYWQQISREFHRESAFYTRGQPGFAGPPLFFDPEAGVAASVIDTDDETNSYEWLSQARYDGGIHQVTVGFDFGYDTSELPETETLTTVGLAGVGPISSPSIVSERTKVDANQIRYGAYVQDSIDLAPFTIIPGMRIDHVIAKDDQTDTDDSLVGVSGSLSAIDKLSDEWSAFATVASGYRAPDLNERFQDTVVNLGVPNRIIGTSELDAERAWGLEVGSKYEGQTVSGELTGFVNYIEDYIGREGVGVIDGMVTERYNNLGEVTLYGPEAVVNVKLHDQVEFFSNVGRTFTEDDEKIDVPDWAFNYGFRFTQPFEQSAVKELVATLRARTLLESEQKTVVPGREPFPSGNEFTTVDLLVSLDLGETGFGEGRLTGGVRNIFDTEYEEPFFPLVQPGINGFVGIELRF